MRSVSMAMSRELRHVKRPAMRRNGFMPLGDLLDTQAFADLRATRDGIRRIARGGGGNDKMGFDLRLMGDGETNAIRASQCHSRESGVGEDVLPVAEFLETLIHGTTLVVAKKTVGGVIHRRGRLHVHLWESDMAGKPLGHRNELRTSPEVVIVLSAERCERYGLVFYRSSNGAIVTPWGRRIDPQNMYSVCSPATGFTSSLVINDTAVGIE